MSLFYVQKNKIKRKVFDFAFFLLSTNHVITKGVKILYKVPQFILYTFDSLKFNEKIF